MPAAAPSPLHPPSTDHIEEHEDAEDDKPLTLAEMKARIQSGDRLTPGVALTPKVWCAGRGWGRAEANCGWGCLDSSYPRTEHEHA
jgi:hypothetical protein